MGWHSFKPFGNGGGEWTLPDGSKRGKFQVPHYTECLDDALLCLELAAQGKGYSIYMFPEEKKPYDVELEVFKVCTDAKTLPLAMCLCALRSVGVPESLITQAMENDDALPK